MKVPLVSDAITLLRYRWMLKVSPRQNRVYTQFYRFPNQYTALIDRILPLVLEAKEPASPRTLEIVLFGCSNGAEPYSLSSVLLQRFPTLQFRIRAFDIVEDVLEKARIGVYPRDEVYQSPFITDAFVEATFDREADGSFRIKPNVAAPVTFAAASILDAELMQKLGTADLVIAQNMLFHLDPPLARIAFNHLIGLLHERSALFVNGMDTDMRIDLTKRHALEPLDYLIEEIHNDARVDRGSNWAQFYWGREPFSRKPKEWKRKFGTIYLRNAR